MDLDKFRKHTAGEILKALTATSISGFPNDSTEQLCRIMIITEQIRAFITMLPVMKFGSYPVEFNDARNVNKKNPLRL